jgi:hypothetical protein
LVSNKSHTCDRGKKRTKDAAVAFAPSTQSERFDRRRKSMRASPSAAPIMVPIAFWGWHRKWARASTPQKAPALFESNRSIGAFSSPVEVSATPCRPLRRARIGRAGASWHVGFRGWGRLSGENTRRFALETTREDWSSALMASCAETEAATRAATAHAASTRLPHAPTPQ